MTDRQTPADKCFTITTGSRLHFGLTRFRPEPTGRFRGVGVMIDQPGNQLKVRTSEYFSTIGSDRLKVFARSWCDEVGFELPNCQLELVSAPPAHCGFGSGTQLAHAVAYGLNIFANSKSHEMEQVANVSKWLDRGTRSMIGSYGFARGGLIVDSPTTNGVSSLAKRVEIPSDWRVVIVMSSMAKKKFGVQEQSAFDSIMTEQTNRSRRLEDLIGYEMIPAAESQDFDGFCNSVHEYGKISGEYYVQVQGGIYNGPAITAMVNSLLSLGATGVGQSSWGPAIFSWCKNQDAAEDLLVRIRQQFGSSSNNAESSGPNHSKNTAESFDCWIATPRNEPATITHHQQPQSKAASPTVHRN